jgi:hypothetical protein
MPGPKGWVFLKKGLRLRTPVSRTERKLNVDAEPLAAAQQGIVTVDREMRPQRIHAGRIEPLDGSHDGVELHRSRHIQ